MTDTCETFVLVWWASSVTHPNLEIMDERVFLPRLLFSIYMQNAEAWTGEIPNVLSEIGIYHLSEQRLSE
jgi:hypothetical protein